MLTVVRSAPLLTVQDRGRFGYRADGVSPSGPLDPLALDVANALAGNALDAAALEGCLGGATFRAERTFTFALTGAEVAATCAGKSVASYATHTANPGDELIVERIVRGAAWYLGVNGGIDTPVVLGSRATLIAAELGGIDGKPIRNGAQIPIARKLAKPRARTAVPKELRAALDTDPIPLTPAPRSDALTEHDWDTFYRTTFTVSRASSRIGYRLEGARIASRLAADLASEPACAGAMQLPPEGNPIVLLAEHPTIGGYPIIGVVPAFALGRFAQCAPGTMVRFAPMTIENAMNARARERAALSQWIAQD
ncbi:MAG TPA: biotin-dependent carboxyltransferase family protein [Gemmatimonadaceae bacterium]|nr:biotin-dependent carboxyltransferase family protein [Gemmatimonadaceae bacterium]